MEKTELIDKLRERYHYTDAGTDPTAAIPLIEREGLKDVSHILRFNGHLLRPTTGKVNGRDCTYTNVLTNFICRLELLRWLNNDGTQWGVENPDSVLKSNKDEWLQSWNTKAFADTCSVRMERRREDRNEARIMAGLMPAPPYKAGALPHLTPYPIRCKPSDNADYMAFAILHKQYPSEGWNKKVATEENALKAINKVFPSEEDRAAVLDAYRDMQAFLKVMAATYRLFATEQWDSIKDEDEETIKTVLDNYFYHYKQDVQLTKFYKASGLKYKPRYKQLTLKSVCVTIGIPEEWRKYISKGKYEAPKPNAGYYKESLALEHNFRIQSTANRQLTIFDDTPIPKYVGFAMTSLQRKAMRAISEILYNEGKAKAIKASIIKEASKGLAKDGKNLVRAYIDNLPIIPIMPYTLAFVMNNHQHPSGRQIKEAEEVINDFCYNKYWVSLPTTYREILKNGKPKTEIIEVRKEISILDKRRESHITEDGVIEVPMYELNPIFTHEISIRSLFMPRDFYNRLQSVIGGKRITKEYEILSSLFIEQIAMRRNKKGKKRNPVYEIDEEKLKIMCCTDIDSYRKNKKRIEDNITDAVGNCKKLGMLTDYKKTTSKSGGMKYVFTLNLDYE